MIALWYGEKAQTLGRRLGRLAGATRVAVRDLRASLGVRPTGERARRVRRSPQYRRGVFRNPVRTSIAAPLAMVRGHPPRELFLGGKARRPTGVVPVLRPDPAPAGPDALRVTWYGHASALVEIEGARLLFDPVWSERCSPSRRIGPRRLHPAPLALVQVPRVDAVVISHDHYDHLDLATVRGLLATQVAPFVVPLGVGAHLAYWGVPAERIIELDWGESTPAGGVRLTATAARHFSGRALTCDHTLWSSWVLTGARRSLFYTGDSGYFAGYAGIGARYGPFDATLMQVGAYDIGWPDVHMTPEEAVTAHLDLSGGLLIPVHWCTFVLALHPWAEPVEWLWRQSEARGVHLAVPRPGERVDVCDPPTVSAWWRALAA